MSEHRWSHRLLQITRSMIVFSSQGLLFPIGNSIAFGIIPQLLNDEPGISCSDSAVDTSVIPSRRNHREPQRRLRRVLPQLRLR